MHQQFTYNTYVPSLERYHRFRLFDNKTHMTVIKYIQNNDVDMIDDIFTDLVCNYCVDDIPYDELNCIDKFVVLLNMRIMCLGPGFEVETSIKNNNEKIKSRVSIDLYEILDAATNHTLNNVEPVESPQGYKLKYRIPTSFKVSSEDLIVEVLNSVIIGDKQHNLSELTNQQKRDVLDELPGDALSQTIKYIKDIDTQYKIPIFGSLKNQVPDELGSLELRIFDNSMFEILKTLYNSNLQDQYYIRYMMVKHMNFSFTEIDQMTPAETQTYITLYSKEIEEQRKSREKQQQKGNGISLPNPDLVS